MRGLVVILGAISILGMSQIAFGAGERPGRYTLNPAEGGGFVRLDTQTGRMSLCRRQAERWTCQDMVDGGLGLTEEIERLRKENKALKDEVRKLEDLALKPPIAPPNRTFKLPSEQDIDTAMNYIQRMFRKFRDKLKEFEDERRRLAPDRPQPDRLGTPL